MKTLLLAIKAKIIADFTGLGDCEIVPEENILPAAARFPFVGVKDGGIKRVEGIFNTLSRTLEVHFIVYQKILKPEASIIGEGETPGVLDLVAQIHTLINHNLLNITGIIGAFCASEAPSEMVFDDKMGMIQKKKCTYVYEEEFG